MKKPSQTETIYKYMQEHGSIGWMEAFRICGSRRLPARISDIKKRYPVVIDDEWETITDWTGEKVRVKRYRIGEQV